ncbi:MAG: VCBS repeat-containing protein, partial [Eudoraea sp.]|nr:VCBS repeat-containing protein [Eudoraea sp.]
CGSCHLVPEREDLPKEIWEKSILPNMAARMGLRESNYDPLAGLSYEEMDAVIKTGIYPLTPSITPEDWQLLKDYIIAAAPDSLVSSADRTKSSELTNFFPIQISLDEERRRSYTYLDYKPVMNEVILGDMAGELMTFDLKKGLDVLDYYESPVVSYDKNNKETYVTTIGNIHPSAISKGKVFKINSSDTLNLLSELHRPVHTLAEDLNNNGRIELVISEFGDLTGELSLFVKNEKGEYDKTVLLNQPGTIRVVAQDMDDDGIKDLVALTSQGDESITILYQKQDLSFEAHKVLRFSPIYGSSWFELIDYEGDGDLDLVTVHGDNADKSYVQKPYHGMRLHLNDGDNNFSEVFFYPMDGATRVVASDFDKDGDIDFGLLSTFPDYKNAADRSFVFLENKDSAAYTFETFTSEACLKAKWFLMDSGDIDGDGDEDIILSSFALPFIPAPEELTLQWKQESIDLMILENRYQ